MPTAPRDGPYLQAALLCERVLLEPDGTPSAIRIIDTFTVQQIPDELRTAGAIVVSLPVQASFLIILKSGSASGMYTFQLVSHSPSGTETRLAPHEAELSAYPHGGATITLQTMFAFSEEGDYRYDLLVNGEFVTAIPLRVVFASASQPT